MNELVTIKKIEQSIAAIKEVKDLKEIKQILDQVEAIKAYVQSAKLSAELQAEVSELSARAKRRLGEISAKLEKKAGKRTDLLSGAEEGTKAEALAEIKVTPQYAHEAEKLARIPETVFEEKIANAKATAEKITNALFKDIGNETGNAKPEKKPQARDWNYIYQNRLSFADEDDYVAELFILANDMKCDDDRVEFFNACIKACKRAIAEMGYA